MAHNIGGYNPALVNQSFTNKLSQGGQELVTVRANTGALSTDAETSSDNDIDEDNSGVQLSSTAQGLVEHEKEVAEHAGDLAQQAGLTQTNDTNENGEISRKRGWDREQAELAKGKDKSGHVEIESKEGVKQTLTVQQHQDLTNLDDPDFAENSVLGDIPDANLNAASAMVENQMSQGVSKVANLKHDPKIAAAAAQFEGTMAPTASEPMDIKQPGNDKLSQPMHVEPPADEERIAHERAAAQLASGDYEQEAMVAGGGPGMNAHPIGGHLLAAPEATEKPQTNAWGKTLEGSKTSRILAAHSDHTSRVDTLKDDLDTQGTELSKSIDKSKDLLVDDGLPQEDADSLIKMETQQAQQTAQNNNQPIQPEIAVARGAKSHGKKNLGGLALSHKDIAVVVDRHSKMGTLDTPSLRSELKKKIDEARKQNDKNQVAVLENASNSADLIDQADQFEDTHNQLNEEGVDTSTLTTDLSRHYDS